MPIYVVSVSWWWFQIFFIFTLIWGRFPIWLIFFKGVETTNQVYVEWWEFTGPIYSKNMTFENTLFIKVTGCWGVAEISLKKFCEDSKSIPFFLVFLFSLLVQLIFHLVDTFERIGCVKHHEGSPNQLEISMNCVRIYYICAYVKCILCHEYMYNYMK